MTSHSSIYWLRELEWVRPAGWRAPKVALRRSPWGSGRGFPWTLGGTRWAAPCAWILEGKHFLQAVPIRSIFSYLLTKTRFKASMFESDCSLSSGAWILFSMVQGKKVAAWIDRPLPLPSGAFSAPVCVPQGRVRLHVWYNLAQILNFRSLISTF